MRLWRMLSVASLMVALAACVTDGAIPIRTNSPSGICPGVAQRGLLVLDPQWGLALRMTDRLGTTRTRGVIWPNRYSARREHGVVKLFDSTGRLVANAGDWVVLDATDEDPLRPCAASRS